MTTVYHGATTYNLHTLLSGQSNRGFGLYVTDTADRAQLYADAQATHEVQTVIRRAPSSAVVELETTEDVRWNRRPDTHTSLDKCEATIKTWQVVHITAYVRRSDLTASHSKINGRYIPTYDYLREQLGDRLTVVVLDA